MIIRARKNTEGVKGLGSQGVRGLEGWEELAQPVKRSSGNHDHPQKYPSLVVNVCPSCCRDRDRRITVAHWPSSLAKLVSAGSFRSCLNKPSEGGYRETSDLGYWPPHSYAHTQTNTYTHIPHIHMRKITLRELDG